MNEEIYYRDIPNKENTAIGVAFLTRKLQNLTYLDTTNTVYKMIQATILELSMKGHIELIDEKNVKLKIIEKNTRDLKRTQLVVLDLIKELANGEKEIDIMDFKKALKTHGDIYIETFRERFIKMVIIEQEELGNCEFNYKKYKKNVRNFSIVFCITAVIIFLWMFFLIPTIGIIDLNKKLQNPIEIRGGITITTIVLTILVIVGLLIQGKILYKMRKNRKIIFRNSEGEIFCDDIITFLTDKGNKERKQWLKLKKFLKEYTLIKDYKAQSIKINEEYLVYATLFGIADETQEDLGKYGPLILPFSDLYGSKERRRNKVIEEFK